MISIIAGKDTTDRRYAIARVDLDQIAVIVSSTGSIGHKLKAGTAVIAQSKNMAADLEAMIDEALA